jgi:hypothetical protein
VPFVRSLEELDVILDFLDRSARHVRAATARLKESQELPR